MESAFKIKSILTTWLVAMVVTLCFGETCVGAFLETPGTSSGQIGLSSPASVGETYDASAYDASGYAVASKTTLSKSQQKSISSYNKRIAEHQKKLDDYKADSDAFGNKGLLKDAPTPEIRQKIIDGRVKHLEKEIQTFTENIDKVKSGG